MSSRRDALKDLNGSSAQHAGLWLDKFIRTQSRDEVGAKQALVEETAKIATTQAVMELYTQSFHRWHKALKDLPDTKPRFATARGRVVVGLGAESVLETAVTLHRTYGMPVIPGSALKGTAAAYARQRLNATWAKPDKAFDPQAKDTDGKPLAPTPYEILFGSTNTAGYITFHDALWEPKSGREGHPLYPDVLTVHHQAYYNQGGNVPPADWDSPILVPFLSTTGRFLIALSGPKEWLPTAYAILALALDELGVGAKTSSGYGRLDLDGLTEAREHLKQETVVQPPPSTEPKQLEMGVEITGNRKGEVKTSFGRGVQVDLNLKAFALPEGKTVVGFIRRADAGGGARGGFRGVIIDFEVDGTMLYLIVKPK